MNQSSLKSSSMNALLLAVPPNENHATHAGEILTWDERIKESINPYRLVSLFVPAPELDVDLFLRGSYGQERFYWSEPNSAENPMTLAGLGIAAEINIPPVLDNAEKTPALSGHRFSAIARKAGDLFEQAIVLPIDWMPADGINDNWRQHLARPRLFGGFSFQDNFIPDNTWSVFNPAQFVLPHYQFVQIADGSFLTINALVAWDENIAGCHGGLRDALLARLTLVLPQDDRSISMADINYPMSAGSWAKMIDRTTQSIQNGELEKVVLSRVCEIRTEQPIDAAATLPYLNQNYSDCYRFFFEPTPHNAFFGATPELLIRKKSGDITTMALAGSSARGQSPPEDAELAQQLISSEKNRHEHQLVVDTIKGNLQNITVDLRFPPEPDMLKLSNIQHLFTPISGRLCDPDTSILTLVSLLHPTPAMGGVPAGAALSCLRSLEPVPRGWYAAPIGWFDVQGDGEFAVAIRSAVSQYARAWLYAGAGIVGDSDADQEWAETALKFRPMLGALGVQERAQWI